jgi:hypothetical protein
MSRTLSIGLLSLALAGGCIAGEVGYQGTAGVSASTPDLVYAGPGVSVIADYDEPIFYTGGFYWWNYGGGWYRSSSYTGGWAYASPPGSVTRIHDPYRYRHYRPSNYRARNRPVPSHRIQRPMHDRRTGRR